MQAQLSTARTRAYPGSRTPPRAPQAFDLERAKYTPDSIQAFYRFIWALFYSEYALLPFL